MIRVRIRDKVGIRFMVKSRERLGLLLILRLVLKQVLNLGLALGMILGHVNRSESQNMIHMEKLA